MMAVFGETWSENDFYTQPVTGWIKFLVPNEWNSQLQPLDLFTAASSSNNTYKKVDSIINRSNTDINKRNHGGWTPLMYAAYYSYENVVDLLLKNGASCHPCNKMGKNALMIAARCGLEVVVETLIKYGSILEARDNDDFTAIFHAVFNENHSVLEILLKYGANPNARVRKTGLTPLMYAARMGSMDMTKILLKKGAITTLTNNDNGKTAAMMAKDSNFQAIADVIIQWKVLASSVPSLRDGPNAIEHRLASLQHCLSPVVKNSNSYALSSTCSVVVSDLPTLLSDIGLEAYTSLFREQQVDLQVFLSMTDQELMECGINKLGPRRKMLAAIERWYHNAPLRYGLEGAYANKVEVENQQLHEKLAEMSMIANKAVTRLDEANKLCRIMKEQLSSANHASYSSYSFQNQNITEQLNAMSSLLEDMFRLTSPLISSEKIIKNL